MSLDALLLIVVVVLALEAGRKRIPRHGRRAPGQEKTPTQTNQDRERNRRRGNHKTLGGE